MHSALSCHYNELMLVAVKWLLEPLEWCRLPYKVTFFETVKLWLKQRLNPGIQTFFHCLFFISELLLIHTCGYKGIFILLILHIRAPYDVQGLFVVDSNGTPGADCRLFSLPSTLQNVQMSFDVGCFLWTRQLGPKAALFQKKIPNFQKKKKSEAHHSNARGTCAFISGCQAAVLDVRFGSSPEADSTHELCLSFTSALCFTLTDLWEIILTK